MTTASASMDLEAIKQLKARYFRLMDTKQWAEWEDLFTEDGVIGPLATGIPGVAAMDPQSRHEFVKQARKNLADVKSIHHGYMPEIELLSEVSARGIWAMDDLLEYPNGSPLKRLRGYGYYHETYAKVRGEWKIHTMALSRLRVVVDKN
jgi:SnoaL-like domain